MPDYLTPHYESDCLRPPDCVGPYSYFSGIAYARLPWSGRGSWNCTAMCVRTTKVLQECGSGRASNAGTSVMLRTVAAVGSHVLNGYRWIDRSSTNLRMACNLLQPSATFCILHMACTREARFSPAARVRDSLLVISWRVTVPTAPLLLLLCRRRSRLRTPPCPCRSRDLRCDDRLLCRHLLLLDELVTEGRQGWRRCGR